MPDQPPLLCPYLGLRADRHSVIAGSSDDHRCYVSGRPALVGEQHQLKFCLTRDHVRCPRYAPLASQPAVSPPVVRRPAAAADDTDGEAPEPRPVGWLDRIVVAIAIGAVLFAIVYFGALFLERPVAPVAAPPATLSSPTVTRTATGTPTARPTVSATPTPRPLQTVVAPAGGQVRKINPLVDGVGWVTNGDRDGVHIGDRSIQAGVFNNSTYIGLIQFDLSILTEGVTVQSAALELTGAREDQRGESGTWQLRFISLPASARLSSMTFEDVRDLKWDFVLQPSLTGSQLGKGQVNRFELNGALLTALERMAGQGKVLFRIDGPATGADDLFAWDSGLGPGGAKPALILSTSGGSSATAKTVVIACVPTPANPAARAALAATATYIAQAFGTPTPYPPNYVTPVAVTATPTPESIFAAATMVAAATSQAARIGTATPTPLNWVVPVVITATPEPANEATAVYQSALATAIAATTGTPTPLPCFVSIAPAAPTATATPLVVYNLPTATPTPTATETPASVPSALHGKIAFMSDREGTPAVYVMDPDGSNVGRLTNRWSYDFSAARQMQADGKRLAVLGQPTTQTRIELFDAANVRIRVLIENGGINYDPAFAPNGYDFAYVSTVSGHDEIYRMNTDVNDVQQLTHSDWEWNKHPSWSPDGKQIVFWSNRVTGRKQIWIMSASGSEPVNLSSNSFSDWDPIWIP